jgi:hypothetical protein
LMLRLKFCMPTQTWGWDWGSRKYRYVAVQCYESGFVRRKHGKKNHILKEVKKP